MRCIGAPRDPRGTVHFLKILTTRCGAIEVVPTRGSKSSFTQGSKKIKENIRDRKDKVVGEVEINIKVYRISGKIRGVILLNLKFDQKIEHFTKNFILFPLRKVLKIALAC